MKQQLRLGPRTAPAGNIRAARNAPVMVPSVLDQTYATLPEEDCAYPGVFPVCYICPDRPQEVPSRVEEPGPKRSVCPPKEFCFHRAGFKRWRISLKRTRFWKEVQEKTADVGISAVICWLRGSLFKIVLEPQIHDVVAQESETVPDKAYSVAKLRKERPALL